MNFSATTHSPFGSSVGYQPPLFPSTEGELLVSCVQHHYCRCQHLWKSTLTALLQKKIKKKKSSWQTATKFPHSHTLLVKRSGCPLIFLSLCNKSKNLSLKFICPFVISSMIIPVSVPSVPVDKDCLQFYILQTTET